MNWFATGAIAAGLGVALGAFGAHVLKPRLASDLLEIFETGVRFHIYHALALLAVGWAASRSSVLAQAWQYANVAAKFQRA